MEARVRIEPGGIRGLILLVEVAAGLEPAKTGFADQRLGLFGIATKPVQKAASKPISKPAPNLVQLYTQSCTQKWV
jgi:hypothetical protein